MLDSRPVHLTRSEAQKALLRNNQENNSDSASLTPLVRNTIKSVKKSSSKEPLINKPLGSAPLIPPNIFMEKLPSISTQPSLIPKPIEPPIIQIPINELTTNPLREETSIPLKPPLETPMFYRVPRKVLKETISPVKKRKHNRIMKLAVGMDQYDILNNMDNIQPQISLRQLLGIAPKRRSELSSSKVRKRAKIVDVHDISLDLGTLVIDVIIDGSLINGVQVESGSSINLINVDTMEELGLTSMTTTPIILKMANQSRVKPLGMLSQLLTTISGIDYKIDYVVFKISESISTYPILLERPWLYLARTKDDWNKGTLTIGKRTNKNILSMYPTQYHGETQEEDTEVTTSNICGSKSESTKLIIREQPTFKNIGQGEYIELLNEEDSDTIILNWKNSLVFGITAEPESEIEPPYQTHSEELIENLSHTSLSNLKTFKSTCINMNLGTENDPKNIRIYSDLTSELLKEWLQFFKDTKDVFAWTYKYLKGIPPEICQHQIVLESNAKPVRQRQYRMNPKYSLMVKEEIDKLLECGFIYLVPHSEWISPIIVVPKKNGKLQICMDFCKLNFVTQKDYFSLPFTDAILDGVA